MSTFPPPVGGATEVVIPVVAHPPTEFVTTDGLTPGDRETTAPRNDGSSCDFDNVPSGMQKPLGTRFRFSRPSKRRPARRSRTWSAPAGGSPYAHGASSGRRVLAASRSWRRDRRAHGAGDRIAQRSDAPARSARHRARGQRRAGHALRLGELMRIPTKSWPTGTAVVLRRRRANHARLSGALGRASTGSPRRHTGFTGSRTTPCARNMPPSSSRSGVVARICRGCTFALLGLATGLAASVWVPSSPAMIAGLLGGSLAWLGSRCWPGARRRPLRR